MAKIQEEIIVIKFSKLVKENAASAPVSTPEIVESLEQVAQELAGAGVIVEIEIAK